MVLVIVVVSITAMVMFDRFVTRRSEERAARRRQKSVEPVITPVPRGPLAYDYAERALTIRLLTGVVGPADYRDAIAALAATDERVTGVNPLRQITLDQQSLDQLGIAMPSVPRSTLLAAVALARNGATVESLTRLLGLTEAQSLRIIITAVGNSGTERV